MLRRPSADHQQHQQTPINTGPQQRTTDPEFIKPSSNEPPPPRKSADVADDLLIQHQHPQDHTQKGFQRFADVADDFSEEHRIGVGSEWTMDGKYLVVTAVTDSNIWGLIAHDDTPIGYADTVENFVKYVDGPAPVPPPEWLRNVANDPNPLKVGDRVEYIGPPCQAMRFYPCPWTIRDLLKDKMRCISAEGEVIPLKCSRQDLRKVEAMAIAQEVQR